MARRNAHCIARSHLFGKNWDRILHRRNRRGLAVNKTIKLLAAVTAVISWSAGLAEQSGRPRDLTLSGFQFGPVNRWAFSHIREVLPTANIAHDNHRVVVLERDEGFLDDFYVPFEGRSQSIDEIASRWYIDGLLILRHGRIVFEKYYGHLTEARPHLMNSVSKSVIGLLAGKLAEDGVIDLSKPVSHYVPALAL